MGADGLEALLQQIDLAEGRGSHGDVDAEEILVEVIFHLFRDFIVDVFSMCTESSERSSPAKCVVWFNNWGKTSKSNNWGKTSKSNKSLNRPAKISSVLLFVAIGVPISGQNPRNLDPAPGPGVSTVSPAVFVLVSPWVLGQVP